MKSLQDEGHFCRMPTHWRSLTHALVDARPRAEELRWHCWLVQGSARHIKGTGTGTLILPAEQEPWVHQLHAALSICIPEVQQICFMPRTAPTWKILPLKPILLTQLFYAIFFQLWKKQTEKKHSFWSFGCSNLSVPVFHYWLYQLSLVRNHCFLSNKCMMSWS